MNSPTAIQTFTGIFFDPFTPDPSLIRIEDIAHALAMQCRFGGHLRKRWTVAQHSLMVCDLCPVPLGLAGLLHDAAEAYVCDLPRPIKHAPELAFYRVLEQRVEQAIAERFGLPHPLPLDIKRADNTILVAEARALKNGVAGWEHERTWEMDFRLEGDDSQLVQAIRNANPPSDEYIRDEFLRTFYALGGK